MSNRQHYRRKIAKIQKKLSQQTNDMENLLPSLLYYGLYGEHEDVKNSIDILRKAMTTLERSV